MRIRREILGLTLACVLGSALGCGEGPVPTQEWTPADHTQPPSQQRDPQRVPRQTQVREESSENPIARAAAALWQVSCASCHGRTGLGDGPQAPAELADFTDPTWQTETSDEEIAQVIMQGRGMMPAFEQIAPQGITALTAHIRAMNREPTPEQQAQQQALQERMRQQLEEMQRQQGQQGQPPAQGPGPGQQMPPGHP